MAEAPAPPAPYYSDELVTLYLGDCLTIAPALAADVIVSDPPYGMGWEAGKVRVGPNGHGGRGRTRHHGVTIAGDDQPFDPSPWLGYPEVILWGANHYGQQLPRGTTLVWIKRLDGGFGSFLSDAEVAWAKGGHGVYLYRDLSMQGEARTRVHPAQKPLGLMRWCIGRTKGATILDPYAGSGSTLVAAKSMGRRSIGIELSERYCAAAAERLAQGVLGLVG